LTIVAENTQRDKVEREEKVQECRRKRLREMLLAIVQSDWRNAKLHGSNRKFTPIDIWKWGDKFGE
jgi:hypothetical protein